MKEEKNKGSALIIMVAMIVFLTLLALAFSRIMVTSKLGTVNTIASPRAYYIAQAGLEYALRYARDNPNTWENKFSHKLSEKSFSRDFGGGRFYLSYIRNQDQLISWARFSPSVRAVALDNFSSKWIIDQPPYFELIDYFIKLIEDFYEENGRYPRSWYPYNYTDLGLDPDDWVDGKDGVIYKPNGKYFRIRPEKHYTFYVDDLDGNTRELSWKLNWDLVYSMRDETWYYHDIAPGNEIDIDTLIVESKN
ncbi:MAG: hypothetical protein U9N73_13705 [Candidatus Auribacterota bacterium]|nr:hypothetical protein [Candidatus Auribacterota bacterium]